MRVSISCLLCALFLLGCDDPNRPPTTEIINVRDFPSADGRYVATVFEETCRCTTGDIPHVYLRRAGEKRGDQGNVFVGPNFGNSAAVTWTSPRSLLVEYRSERSLSLSTTNIDGVNITFTNVFLPNEKCVRAISFHS